MEGVSYVSATLPMVMMRQIKACKQAPKWFVEMGV